MNEPMSEENQTALLVLVGGIAAAIIVPMAVALGLFLWWIYHTT